MVGRVGAVVTMYGTPERVEWCSRCVVSNQRPSSVVEKTARPEDPKPTIAFHHGVCSACLYVETKKRINWDARAKQLEALCDKHRGRKPYDVVVPGSGGKDSMYVAHMLKHRYGMTPVTVTGSPIIQTEAGRRNFDAWRRIADNVLFTPHDYQARVRDAFIRFGHPFKPFIESQLDAGPRLAKQLGIGLVMYGEPRAERGNDISETETPVMDRRFYADAPDSVEVHYFGWYNYWRTQANFYYAVDNCGFMPNDERTCGTYSRMNSFDDVVDDIHYLTTFAKFGLGRATYNAVDDIRDGYLSREDAVALVKRYDGEWPNKTIGRLLDYLGMEQKEFDERLDAMRPDHLWERVDGEWQLKQGCAVWHE